MYFIEHMPRQFLLTIAPVISWPSRAIRQAAAAGTSYCWLMSTTLAACASATFAMASADSPTSSLLSSACSRSSEGAASGGIFAT